MLWFLAQYSSPYSPEYIKRLETKADNYETLFYFLILVSIFLFLAVVYQFLKIRKMSVVQKADNRYKTTLPKQEKRPVPTPASRVTKGSPVAESRPAQVPNASSNHPSQKDLPDPGLIYKYTVHGDSPEKVITIGQKEGTIKTYSTEVMDHHLTIMIRPLNSGNRDIYDLPDLIEEEYVVDFRRGAKAIFNLPASNKIEEMGARMRIYIKSQPDAAGDPTFSDILPNDPIRFRLGDRLTQDGKFRQGYFEFHFYTKSVETTTKAGIKCIEKNFFVKLFKIYPGYDTASQNEDGLFAMIDPFAKR
jgi:hypothetical protein